MANAKWIKLGDLQSEYTRMKNKIEAKKGTVRVIMSAEYVKWTKNDILFGRYEVNQNRDDLEWVKFKTKKKGITQIGIKTYAIDPFVSDMFA